MDEDAQFRYTVHVAEGGAFPRAFNEPLKVDGIVTHGSEDFIVIVVEQPTRPGSLGQAWVELA